MKTLVVSVVALVVLVGLACLLFPWAGTYLRQSRDKIDQGIKANVDNDHVYNEACKELDKQAEDLVPPYANVLKCKRVLANQQAELENQEKQLAKAEGYLNQDMTWIDNHGPSDKMALNGKEYAYAIVVEDASNYAEQCATLRTTIDAFKQSCGTTKSAIEESEINIEATVAKIAQEKSELIAKKMVVDALTSALNAQQDSQAMVKGLMSSGNDAQAISKRALDEMNNRKDTVTSALRLKSKSQSNTGGKSPIPRGDNAIGSQADMMEVVNAYRDKYLKPQTPTVSPEPAKVQ